MTLQCHSPVGDLGRESGSVWVQGLLSDTFVCSICVSKSNTANTTLLPLLPGEDILRICGTPQEGLEGDEEVTGWNSWCASLNKASTESCGMFSIFF